MKNQISKYFSSFEAKNIAECNKNSIYVSKDEIDRISLFVFLNEGQKLEEISLMLTGIFKSANSFIKEVLKITNSDYKGVIWDLYLIVVNDIAQTKSKIDRNEIDKFKSNKFLFSKKIIEEENAEEIKKKIDAHFEVGARLYDLITKESADMSIDLSEYEKIENIEEVKNGKPLSLELIHEYIERTYNEA